jgi:hypothetical protein
MAWVARDFASANFFNLIFVADKLVSVDTDRGAAATIFQKRSSASLNISFSKKIQPLKKKLFARFKSIHSGILK